MEEIKYKVYVKTDENGFVTDINSEVFLSDTSGWIEIDEGSGDKYALASGNYLGKPVCDILYNGGYNYRLVDGKIEAVPDNEKSVAFDENHLELTMNDIALALAEIYEILMEVK